MKYDIKYDNEKVKGFYVWNKPTFFVKKDDDRYETLIKQKADTGISEDETWDLRTNIAIFLIPRLKLFKDIQNDFGGYPGCFKNKEEWHEILDKIIFAFEAHLKDDFYVPDKYLEKYSEYDYDRTSKARDDYWTDIQEGLNLFAKYFGCFWW